MTDLPTKFRSAALESPEAVPEAGTVPHPGSPIGTVAADEPEEPLPFRGFTRRRMLTGLLVALVVLLLIIVPPLVNVSRYKRQIASSIGRSLGRPVHMDNVTLNLLPWPGFTLENFVVGEDAAFGSEPVLRAEQVTTRVRVRSLWHRRLEFSRILLSEPSINLVHLPDGRWNLESILLQASHLPAATSPQRNRSGTIRFPYIEASGARINLKLGQEKTPFSLTEADVALWLPEPDQWHVRVKAHPTRTDTAVSDTGVFRLDGTLGQAATLAAVPVALEADWTGAPLGALSLIVLGRDAGMRGTMHLHATATGTAGTNTVAAQMSLDNVRRAEFVPQRTLAAAITCSAHVTRSFHTIEAAHCTWPGQADGSGLSADLQMPETMQPSTASGLLTLSKVPLAGMLDTLRMASDRVSPDLQASGTLSGTLPCCSYSALFASTSASAASPALTLQNASFLLPEQPLFQHETITAAPRSAATPSLAFSAIPLQLAGRDPATLTLQLSPSAVELQLTGEIKQSSLLALARALPQFGDGLEQALPAPLGSLPSNAVPESTMYVNLQGQRLWLGGTRWSPVPTPPVSPRPKNRPHAHRTR